MTTVQVPPPASQRPGANEPCWCGSGQKYKKCHRDGDARAPVGLVSPRKRVMPGRVSPRRKVPAHIRRPEWAENGRVSEPRPGESVVMNAEQLVRMRRACGAAARVLAHVGSLVRPGITTDELDALAHEEYVRLGGYPSTLNYKGYPKSICTSVNEVICHGIPDSRALEDGDIVNLDVTIYLDGMHGDCSATVAVGNVTAEDRRLMDVAQRSMEMGIQAARAGKQIREIGRAIERFAASHGMGSVRAFCGHGIGERFHNSLQIPHYDDPHATTVMRPGMVFTVEPMITLGTWRHGEWDDGWTVVTADGRNTAQYEHTILITEDGPEILTRPDVVL
ncbi:MAG: type I methionyl aminopeptidase [Myxococcota bacterium]